MANISSNMTIATRLNTQIASPLVEDFVALRIKVGWQSIDKASAQRSLDNSLFHVAIYDQDVLVGMGRVVGDGVMYFYVQDIAVDPDYQGFGIGDRIMTAIEGYLSNTAISGATIGLLAVKGKETFYARYGYFNRPNATLGHGMCKFF